MRTRRRFGQPRINLLPAEAFGAPPAGAAQIGLRPENIESGEGARATVRRVERLPPEAHHLVAHLDAALVQQVLGVPERQREPARPGAC